MLLEKAILQPLDVGVPKIEFMFNPTEIEFTYKVNVSESPGAKAQESGKPKVSFSSIEADTAVISNIVFDTYESQVDVVSKYIVPFKKALEFVAFVGGNSQGGGNSQRTPLYTFVWGTSGSVSGALMPCCFIESLSYKLTMFLPNGTPVRAEISSLTLKEADPSMLPSMRTPIDVNRTVDSLENRRAQLTSTAQNLQNPTNLDQVLNTVNNGRSQLQNLF